MEEAYFSGPPDLETPAGKMLRRLAEALPSTRDYKKELLG